MKQSAARRADLAAAHKRFNKKGETISLEDLARLWGVSKARFVNIRNDIGDFPEPIAKQGNALLYAARPALDALIRHEKRNDQALGARSAKVQAILGTAAASDLDETLSTSELLQLSRASAEIERRKREQGQLLIATDTQQRLAEVFGYLSGVLGKLSDNVDPNGRLPAGPRGMLDKLGKELLLRMYGELRDMLGGDVDGQPSGNEAPRARPSRSRKRSVRR